MNTCGAVNVLTFTQRTMAENSPNQSLYQYYGRQLARVGDLKNNQGRRNDMWNFGELEDFTVFASFGVTTGLAVFLVCRFVHRNFIRNEWMWSDSYIRCVCNCIVSDVIGRSNAPRMTANTSILWRFNDFRRRGYKLRIVNKVNELRKAY